MCYLLTCWLPNEYFNIQRTKDYSNIAMRHLLTGLFSFPFERSPSPRSHHPVHNLVKKSHRQPINRDCKELSVSHNNKKMKKNPVQNLVFKGCEFVSRCQFSRNTGKNNVKKSQPGSAPFVWWQKLTMWKIARLWNKQTNLSQTGVIGPTAPLSISAARNFPAEHEIRSHQTFPFHLQRGDGH